MKLRTITLVGILLVAASICSGSNKTVYHYDNQDRLTGVNYPDGKKISYTYDAAGNMLTQKPLSEIEVAEKELVLVCEIKHRNKEPK